MVLTRETPPLTQGVLTGFSRFQSEDEARLQLEHPRRVDVCERRDCIRGRADSPNELAERGQRCRAIAVDRDSAAEEVPVIEDIEAFQPEQDTRVF